MSVSLHTTQGSLKLHLYYRECPLASENFLVQCASSKFDGLKAKANDRGFAAQFTSKVESIHGTSQETSKDIRHARGTISVQRAGRSGFYLAYAEQPHLDGKNTVFGRLIEGQSLLDELEELPANEFRIESTEIHANPFAVK